METRFALHSVAHRVSHQFPQNQRCRAKIALHHPKSRCRTFLRTPLSHFPLIRSRARGGCRGGLVQGIAALLGSENGSRYRGVSQPKSHQSGYSGQLSSLVFPKIPRQTSKTPRISLNLRTLKKPGKYAQNTPKDQGIAQEEKHQGNKNTKEKSLVSLFAERGKSLDESDQ